MTRQRRLFHCGFTLGLFFKLKMETPSVLKGERIKMNDHKYKYCIWAMTVFKNWSFMAKRHKNLVLNFLVIRWKLFEIGIYISRSFDNWTIKKIFDRIDPNNMHGNVNNWGNLDCFLWPKVHPKLDTKTKIKPTFENCLVSGKIYYFVASSSNFYLGSQNTNVTATNLSKTFLNWNQNFSIRQIRII